MTGTDPVEVFRMPVAFGQCDPNGHLNTAQYTAYFDRASWLFLELLGVRDDHGKDATLGWADVRVVTEYKQEVRVGDVVRVTSSLVRVGKTSITLRHEMHRVPGDDLCATYESVTVRFDLNARRAVSVPERLHRLGQPSR